MKIIESWEDEKANIYAIVKHSRQEQQKYEIKEFESMYMIDGELNSFGGSVGYYIADFDTPSRAEEFLLKGIFQQDACPDIWLEMVKA